MFLLLTTELETSPPDLPQPCYLVLKRELEVWHLVDPKLLLFDRPHLMLQHLLSDQLHLVLQLLPLNSVQNVDRLMVEVNSAVNADLNSFR